MTSKIDLNLVPRTLLNVLEPVGRQVNRLSQVFTLATALGLTLITIAW